LARLVPDHPVKSNRPYLIASVNGIPAWVRRLCRVKDDAAPRGANLVTNAAKEVAVGLSWAAGLYRMMVA
jgi:hypothetical protein